MKTPPMPEIKGEVLRLKREAKGWTLSDMASRACLSVKQVRQLEEGGLSSFYSESVKINTVRRVADILGADHAEVLSLPEEAQLESDHAHVVAAPAPSQKLDEVSELLQGAGSPHIDEAESESSQSKIWMIGLAAVVAVAAIVMLREPSVTSSSPVSMASEPLPEASDAAVFASDVASAATDTASQVQLSASSSVANASMPLAVSSGAASLAMKPASGAAVAASSQSSASAARSAASMSQPLKPVASGVASAASASMARPVAAAASAVRLNASAPSTSASHP
jgi:transcriptional regulator with XRE-family HTH domain